MLRVRGGILYLLLGGLGAPAFRYRLRDFRLVGSGRVPQFPGGPGGSTRRNWPPGYALAELAQ